MTMLVFVCGLAIGAIVAHFATSTPIVVHTTTIAAEPESATLACRKCGVTGGRRGPFLTAAAVNGHMRACPRK